MSSQVRLHWIVVVLIHGFELSRTIHARGKEWQARLEVEGRWPLTGPGISQQGRESVWYDYSWSSCPIVDVERGSQAVALMSHIKIRGEVSLGNA